MIYTFGALHNKLVDKPDTVKKMGEVMIRGLEQRLGEVVGEGGMIPFLLIAGFPDETERQRKLGWFFPTEEAE